jgi:hypothetical protein
VLPRTAARSIGRGMECGTVRFGVRAILQDAS